MKNSLTIILLFLLARPCSATLSNSIALHAIDVEKCCLDKALDTNAIKLLPLKTHGGTPGAGCYIQDKKDRIYCQLLADEVYFNINNKDELYKQIIKKSLLPKGYTYGFTNGIYKIFIKEIPIKKDGCLTTNKYKIIIGYKSKMYKQELVGFCGC